ncbi:hypothetical protein Q765_01160 [Flavobacterium rivuli WB 3.3-2 = DSM 21788]|uniref:Transglutaminase-like domain-containing protein n=1 Tax=Flavobacterium rivuli WB 3.3-2 = DSM 21788 TaxID=1121895 RepID=A0A0A2MA68_9FLAO|nr:transglutaminase-like domain-containing protein [Flavobacterium rivuli]KGO88546.1 hypothetical protein Q765_01160 [Flavobacterium rivuli WB 3.3-2 = DSM 21788]
MKLKFIISFLSLFCATIVYSQPETSQNYAAIDSAAAKIIYKNDLKLLSVNLTSKYNNDMDKARSIFYWITQNIAYDYKFINKEKNLKFPDCKKGDDCTALYVKWEDNYLHEVITSGKSICEGYSRLFKRLCDYAGIHGSVVSGYTKYKPSQIGSTGPLNHAWNAVVIDNNYYFLDVTWASGYCGRHEKDKLKPFVKKFSNYYWLTPVDKLSRNHFPKDSVWYAILNIKLQKKNTKKHLT